MLGPLRVSGVYETAPVHVSGQPMFLNTCCVGRTVFTARRLLQALQGLERKAGRPVEGLRFGPRVLDLDLLLYGDEVIEQQGLTIPHPRMRDRAFVLIPLAEIAAEWQVPAPAGSCSHTVGDLAATVPRVGIVRTSIQLAER